MAVMYGLLRDLLFLLPPETSHDVSLRSIGCLERLGASGLIAPEPPSDPRVVMGLTFPNPVGLAAGLDKDGRCIDGLAALGFGFVEIGTVTPRPQPGNPLPRLFRLPEDQGLINRMGFNNDGVEALVARLARIRRHGIVGVNIGRNKDTTNENALDDYVTCLRRVFDVASYVTVNISSPNTPGLRDLQHEASLRELLSGLTNEYAALEAQSGRRPPLALKIAPDLEASDIELICGLLVEYALDGVIVSNTTLGRDGLRSQLRTEAGGLSGAPLRKLADAALKRVAVELAGRVAVIGVGGIMTGDDARRKLDLGADLVQIYSGFIYRGPGLIRESVEACRAVGPQTGGRGQL